MRKSELISATVSSLIISCSPSAEKGTHSASLRRPGLTKKQRKCIANNSGGKIQTHTETHFPVGKRFTQRSDRLPPKKAPQVGDECGRSGVYKTQLGNNWKNTVVGVSFQTGPRQPRQAFSSAPPAAPTGCPHRSPLQEHHVTTLTPASPRLPALRTWTSVKAGRDSQGGVQGPPGALDEASRAK